MFTLDTTQCGEFRWVRLLARSLICHDVVGDDATILIDEIL